MREIFLGGIAIFLVICLIYFSKSAMPQPVESTAVLPERHTYQTFQGNVKTFELADLWILSNPAERNLESLLAFVKARSGGLHYSYVEHTKKQKNREEILFGIYMRINAEGVFDSVSVAFTESKNASFATDVSKYIKENWRYRRASDKTELILPIRFKP